MLGHCVAGSSPTKLETKRETNRSKYTRTVQSRSRLSLRCSPRQLFFRKKHPPEPPDIRRYCCYCPSWSAAKQAMVGFRAKSFLPRNLHVSKSDDCHWSKLSVLGRENLALSDWWKELSVTLSSTQSSSEWCIWSPRKRQARVMFKWLLDFISLLIISLSFHNIKHRKNILLS